MVQMIIIIAALCALLAFSAYYANKPVTVVEKRRMRECSKEELAAMLIENSKQMRVFEDGGNGIRCASLYREITRAGSAIEKKVEAKIPVSDGEKWFYENFYLVYRFVFAAKDDMRELPHIDGEPRIIRLARIIVDNSLGDLNPSRIRYLLGKMKTAFSFTYGELREFDNALGIAVIEQIYILAMRLNYNDKCKKAAANGVLNRKYLSRDVYLYYLLQNNRLSRRSKEELDRFGIEKNSVLMNYNFVLLRNTVMAETLFGALMDINSFAPVHIGLKYLGAYRIISDEYNLDDVSPETLCEYFNRIEKTAIKCKVSEEYAAKKLIELSRYNGKDVSVVLFDYGRNLKRYICTDKPVKLKPVKTIGEGLYAAGITLSAIAAAVGLGILLGSVVFGILSFIPLIFIVENILNYLLSHLKCGFEPPAMSYKKVPYEHSVMIVVSEYITGLNQLKESIFHAKTLIEGNKDPNVTVGLLIDTKGGDMPVSDLDREIIEYVTSMGEDDNLNVFLRKKCYSGNKFVAKERKRGAIMALTKLLIMKEDFEFLYIRNRNFITPTYIVTLDADNTVLPGEIIRMANMMAHPYNKKYDLLAMHSKNSLFSLNNYYSLRFMSESGFESYPNYTGLYYRLFRREIFCGKGIFRLEKFYNKLEEILPSGKILSHDILEGSILNTGSGGMCFEDAPENFLSDRERRKRWQRGDAQLLPFMCGLWKNDDKKRCKSYISPLGRFVIAKNILSMLKETCIFVLLLFGLCVSPYLLYAALALYAAPYVINQIKILRRASNGENGRSVAMKSLENVFFFVEDFFMLGYYAVDNLTVMLTTFAKMLFGKNLLEWKTFYSSQSARGFSAYVREFSLPTLAITATVALLFGLGFVVVPALAYIPATLLVYHALYMAATTEIRGKKLHKKEESKLLELAKNTYKYFCYMRNESGLIGDNLQLKPYKGVANSTSPTNIAFSILAEICAFELDIISFEECVFNVERIISAIEKLPKWNGNLYNWYDIKEGKPLNEFVSSVDNGNLAATLLLASEYFGERGERFIAAKAELIAAGMELDKLYDKTKNLFFIGYDGKQCMGHYDLLASESRILSFVYVATHNDYTHYACLQKDYSRHGGNVLLSWSGTMFEMLMSDIFFSAPRGSALYESAKYTVKAQKRNMRGGVWGTSESGYYGFDPDMKYQYSAFGIGELALSGDVEEDVISPYSSILALGYDPKSVADNIDRFYSMGASFEYGLYECVDFSGKARIVYSAMSHHQGMILASITNFLKGNVLPKTLAKSPKINSVLNYFNDLQPTYRISAKKYEKSKKCSDYNNNYYKNIDKIEQNYCAAGLTDTQYSVICNSLGGGFSKNLDILVNKFGGVYEENDGMFTFASKDGSKWFSPTFLPFGESPEKFSFGYSEEEIFFSSADGLIESVTLLPSVGGEVRRLQADGDYKCAAFYTQICVDTKDAFDAHPAFRNLFCNVKRIAPNIVLVTKRMPGRKAEFSYVAVRVEGLKNIEWECNRLNFIGRGKGLSRADFLFGKDTENFYPSSGDVLSPCIGFKGDFATSRKDFQVSLLYGTDEQSLLQTVASLPEDMYRYARQSVRIFSVNPIAQELLGPIVYAPQSARLITNIVESGKNESYKKYTGYKKIVQYVFNENKPEYIFRLAEIIAQIRMFGFEAIPAIYSAEKLSQNTENYIVNIFKEKRISDYRFTYGLCDEKYWHFIELAYDLSFTPKPFVPSKLFHAERRTDGNPDGENCNYPEVVFATGNGGFDASGRYIVTGATKMPYTNVIAQEKGGVIVTADGDGFYYFGNSREDKCVRFDNDVCGRSGGEKFFVKTLSGYIDVFGGSGKGRYSVMEKGRYIHQYFDKCFSSTVSTGVICDGSVKISEVKITKNNGEYLEFLYSFYPAAGWRYEPTYTGFSQTGNVIRVDNLVTGKNFYVKILGANLENLTILSEKDALPYFEYYCENEEEKFTIISSGDLSLLHSLNENNIALLKTRSADYFGKIGDIDVTSPEKSLNYIVDFLPYQIASSRLNAKSGFYQVGGATGFRDQLQDALAFFTKPEILKERIIAACLHQYEAGDVMHWWHEPRFGLRTRITDDKLFLPYAVCKYIEYSGDVAFLDEEFEYLKSPELRPDEKDRFENPPLTDYKESVFTHCLRAIRSSLRYGEHRLLVMGSGDWNDGMDAVCEKGRGESVFNSMLCVLVLDNFSELCPEDLKNEMNTVSVDLKNAVNLYAYENDRYKRLFSDDGRWLGSDRSESLKLDLLVQAFAVISGVAVGDRATTCLKTAERLIDRQAGLIRLLSPCQGENDYLGYISDYPKGIRENGGQYTHAAMWYLIALVKIGRSDEAFDLFQMINPVEKCRDKAKNDVYMCEPYVLCGDVYSNKDNYGRGGWSWYTGSAGWAYKLVTEYFYGLKRRGEELYIEPSLPKKLEGSVVVYRYKNSSYVIEYHTGLLKKITVDGVVCDKIRLGENVRKRVVVETGY